MKITIKDIAEMAGVSHSTVSRSLNGNESISSEVRERIQKIAKDIGFEFNSNARSLSTKRTGTIGLIVPDGIDDITTGSFFGGMIATIRKKLAIHSYDCIIDFAYNLFTGEDNINKLAAKNKVDGFIIIIPGHDRLDFNLLTKNKIPFIFTHFIPYKSVIENPDFVCSNNEVGGYLAAEYLYNAGHRKLALLTLDRPIEIRTEFTERTAGFMRFCAERGIDKNVRVIRSDITYDAAFKITEENLVLFKNITGIFIQTDLMAFAVMDCLKENGFKIPNDISVIGYDDINFGQIYRPKLTTIHQPIEELSEISVKQIINRVEKRDQPNISSVIAPKVTERESVKRIEEEVED